MEESGKAREKDERYALNATAVVLRRYSRWSIVREQNILRELLQAGTPAV